MGPPPARGLRGALVGRYLGRVLGAERRGIAVKPGKPTAFGRIDGVMSSSDYPGVALAGAIAAELGLAGSRPERVLTAAHKYYSRIAQRAASPEAVPDFALVDLRGPAVAAPLAFPCWLKPVKGSFSMFARRIDGPEAFRAFVDSPLLQEFADGYMAIFNRMVAAYTDHPIDGRALIAEGVLRGDLVTIEGFVCDGPVEVLGIVDSTLHANGSFARFDYPSALPAPVTRARRTAPPGIAPVKLPG